MYLLARIPSCLLIRYLLLIIFIPLPQLAATGFKIYNMFELSSAARSASNYSVSSGKT